MSSRGKRMLALITDKKLCLPSEEDKSYSNSTEKIVEKNNIMQDIAQQESLQNVNSVEQPSTSGLQKQCSSETESIENCDEEGVTSGSVYHDKYMNVNDVEQPSTSGLQKKFSSKTYAIENNDEESVTSGSEYLPSSDGEYSDSFIFPKRHKHENVHRIKRKVFFDDKENDKEAENLDKKTIGNSKNDASLGLLDEDILEVEGDGGTQDEDVPRNLEPDQNVEMHNNRQKFHVTADGIRNSATVKPDFKVAKKRARNPEKWKRNKAAKLRQQGEAYVSQKTGKVVEKKVIKDGILCKESCRLKCSERFSIQSREKILEKFYKLDINSKNVLIFKSIKMYEVNRHRSRKNLKTKCYSFKYTVTCDKETALVCKDAFCSLYRIGRKKVFRAQQELKAGQVAPSPHKQGHHTNPKKIPEDVITCIENHIKQFPPEESHYSRNKNQYKKYISPLRKRIFSRIIWIERGQIRGLFRSRRVPHLSFYGLFCSPLRNNPRICPLSPLLNINKLHQLYIEQCEERKLENKYMVKASFYRHIFETKFNLSFGAPKSDTCSICDAGENTSEHTENFQFAFALQKVDREVTVVDKEKCYITMDLQQTMPLPKLSTSKSFYLRQMWLYNFGVHCITSSGHKSYFFTWTEDIANRGSNEIASCLLRFCKLLKEENAEIEHLIIWSDQCGGQNKNFSVISLYEYLILNNVFKIIDHKFPEVGHSYLDSDRDFGRIEKVLRKHQNIYIPDQYREIIKSASTRQSLCFNMEHFFYDFETLPAKLHLYKKVTNTLNQKIYFRDKVKWIRVNEFGKYSYKTNLDPFGPFMEVDLQKKRETVVQAEKVVLQKLPKCGGLTSEKISNLQDQLKFIPTDYRWYFDIVLGETKKNPKKNRKTY